MIPPWCKEIVALSTRAQSVIMMITIDRHVNPDVYSRKVETLTNLLHLRMKKDVPAALMEFQTAVMAFRSAEITIKDIEAYALGNMFSELDGFSDIKSNLRSRLNEYIQPEAKITLSDVIEETKRRMEECTDEVVSIKKLGGKPGGKNGGKYEYI